MKRYPALCGGLVAAMLMLYGVAEATDAPMLTDSTPLPRQGGVPTAASGVTLLVVDVVLPVPSSLVMVAHGALFGVALGILLSMAGSLGAFAVGFAAGRRGVAVLARVVPDEERRRADRLLARWGLVGIILSRPVPILAETVSLLAGASPLRWRSALGAAALGSLPAAALYAMAGAAAATFASGAAVFVVVLALASGAALLTGRRRRGVAKASAS